MGRTLPSITQTFLMEQEAFTRFRRALRRSDQIALDDLFVSAQKHLAAAAYAAHALPLETFMLSMLLEEHKEVQRLRRQMDEVTGQLPAGEIPLLLEDEVDEEPEEAPLAERVETPLVERVETPLAERVETPLVERVETPLVEPFKAQRLKVDTPEVIDVDPDQS